MGSFELFFNEGEFKGIGLKWGFSGKLKGLGFDRPEQIFLLNQLEQDIRDFKIGEECLGSDIKGVDSDKGFFIVCDCGNILNKKGIRGR